MKGHKDQPTPPRIGRFILRQIYDEQHYDEVCGDLLEIYQEQVIQKGKLIASFNYLIDALCSIRNYDLKKHKRITQNNSIAMFKNYLKVTIRTISNNKIYSALNIMGLALGTAAFIFILQYVTYENSYDKFHENHENIYRVRYKVFRGEELQIDCAAAVPRVGPFMKENMPAVMEFTRAFPISGVMSRNHIKFREERIDIVDPAFLKIFDYPLLHGDINHCLDEPNQVVITESMARKYFNRTDVVGEKITFSTWLELQLEITGVTTDVPENSHLKFDFLISYETLNAQTQRDDGTISSETSWGWYDFNTYVELADNTETKTFDRKFQELVMEERKEVFEKYQFHAEFPLQPITDIHLYSNLLQESEPEEQGDGEAVFFLSIIAFFILIIAWINYINLSTARSMERAKEVGIRKTMGAYKKQLIYQFLSEAFVLNFIALIIGLLIVIGGIGYFNRLTGSLLSLEFLISSQFWLIAIGVFTLGVLLSGLYPAFVLSSFKPTSVLKGKLSGNKAGKTLRRALVTFQFAASVALIAGTLIVYQQLNHMRNIDLGFNLTNTLVIEGPQIQEGDSLYASKLSAFKNSLREQHNITNVTASSNVPGDEIFWTNNIRKQEDPDSQSKTIYIAGVDHEYFPTYDITLLAGRNYEKSHPTDTGAIILNKSAIQFLGYPNPESAINQKVHFWGTSKTIIGVVDDYRQMSAKSNVAPIVFPLIKDGSGFYTLSLTGSNFYETLTYTQEVFAQFFPEDPFDYFFLDQFFNRQYNNERNFSRVFTLFAVFGVIVACLGLFGLSSFTALQRTKEIGIRKALGSSLLGIVFLLSREFLILIGLANLIAWPLIYLVMENWLNNFATRITVNLWVFLISGFIVLVTAVCTVGYKTLSTAKSNPVKALRYE